MPLTTSAVSAAVATTAKQLADLIDQLNKSVTDRRLRDLVLPVKEKALEVQHAALDVQREQFRLEQLHAKEMAESTAKYMALERQHSQLEQEHANLKQTHANFKHQSLVLHFGFLWDDRLNPHCPVCRTPLRPHANIHFAHCPKCAKNSGFIMDDRDVTLGEIQAAIKSLGR